MWQSICISNSFYGDCMPFYLFKIHPGNREPKRSKLLEDILKENECTAAYGKGIINSIGDWRSTKNTKISQA